jgi:hypothetical protein
MAKKTETKKSADKDTKKIPVKKTAKTSRETKRSSSKPTAKTTSYTQEVKVDTVAENNKPKGRSIRVHKVTVIIAVVIILLGVLLYYGRGFFVAAVVNGQPISRLAIVQEAEKASGRQAMASLIRNTLVEQEAREQNVTVSEGDVDKQIKTVEDNLSKQGQKLDQMLSLEGMTRDDLRRIIRVDLLVTKLVEKDIKVTDAQVADYIEKNRELLPTDKKEEDLKKDAREQLRREQLAQKAQAWLADLEKNATVVKFVEY